jgi:hypothetical protein
MHNIFLSHTSTDKPFTRILAESLKNVGITVWIDEAEIKVGDSLIEKIRDGIDSVDYFGIILSPFSVKSDWVKKELDVAMNQEIENKKVKVIPILHKKCDLPGFLKGKKYADFTTSFTEGYNELMRRLTPLQNSDFLKGIFLKENAGSGKSSVIVEFRDFFDSKLAGSYQINGTNPNGNTYYGVAEIVCNQKGITITSLIGKNTFICKGTRIGNKLTVSGDFNVTYEVLISGQIIGIWDEGGTEILIPHDLIGQIPINK